MSPPLTDRQEDPCACACWGGVEGGCEGKGILGEGASQARGHGRSWGGLEKGV